MALAGIFQAAALVHQIASRGTAENLFFTTSVKSLLKPSTQELRQIYGAEGNLKPGMENLAYFLKQQPPSVHYAYIVKYVFGLLRLGSLLRKDAEMVARIAQAMDSLQKKFRQQDSISLSIVESLAKIYYENFSQLSAQQRIRVRGKEEYLKDLKNVSRIRALLLAGVRSAILWHNLGGSQLVLLFKKKRLIAEWKEINNKISS